MTTVVVDASVGVSWIHAAQTSERMERLLSGVGAENKIQAPALWHLEVANAVLALERRGKLSAEQRARGVSRLIALPIEIDHQTVAFAWTRIFDLATALKLSIYDAAYLELAQRQQSLLATRDESLRAGAREVGVQLWE